LDDVSTIKEFVLREFKLTHREYRARFNAATRAHDETHTLFVSRLKNLFSFYMRTRECDSYEKLVDLVVADRLKDTLSGPCMKYCLSIKGKQILSASELASLADVFDVNYIPDGRYRGGTVTNLKDTGSATQGASRSAQPVAVPPPEIPRMGKTGKIGWRQDQVRASKTHKSLVDKDFCTNRQISVLPDVVQSRHN